MAPLSNAERQKRYRERLKNDPEKKERRRLQNLAKVKQNTKKVQDMTLEEKENQRKIWREQKKRQKEQKQKPTPTPTVPKEKKQTNEKNIKRVKAALMKSLKNIENLNKNVRTQRQRTARQRIYLTKKIHMKNQEIEKLKCRNEVLETVIKATYKTSSILVKRNIKNAALNETRRHNVHSKVFLSRCLGIKQIKKYNKKQRNVIKSISEEIEKFFTRDDISRTTAGKRECRTKNKERKQIRYMTDTLVNLYKIYKEEGGKLSFGSFYKYKPFFVLSPTNQSRDTCLCVKHSNIDYVLKAIKNNGLIEKTITLKEILGKIACDIESFECMHSKCSKCNSTFHFEVDESRKDVQAKWYEWESAKHAYMKKDKSGEMKEMHTRKTTKTVKTGTLLELMENFKEKLKNFKKHYFNMKTQQQQYQQCIRQLKSNEVLILSDFSENYNGKLSEEIQAMHFGASKQQVTLHCVMVYWQDTSQSFCTVSDSPCHEPAGIWAHLLPVIRYIREQTPNIKVIHFYSDGPTSQYRQKKNYFLLNLFVAKMNMSYATWSFTESGHGKGVADGIGGSVKRTLDRQVLYGHDVQNADDAFKNINTAMKTVKCFLVPEQEIENIKKIIPTTLRPVAGNNDVHQIITTKEANAVRHRPLSCFCGVEPGLCLCYLPKRHLLLEPIVQSETDQNKDNDEVMPGSKQKHRASNSTGQRHVDKDQNKDDDKVIPGSKQKHRASNSTGQRHVEKDQNKDDDEVMLGSMQKHHKSISTSQGHVEKGTVFLDLIQLPVLDENQMTLDDAMIHVGEILEVRTEEQMPARSLTANDVSDGTVFLDLTQLPVLDENQMTLNDAMIDVGEILEVRTEEQMPARSLTANDVSDDTVFLDLTQLPVLDENEMTLDDAMIDVGKILEVRTKKDMIEAKDIVMTSASPAKKIKTSAKENETPVEQKRVKIIKQVRSFYCNLCKEMKRFNLNAMVKCNICRTWFCTSCARLGGEDYVCSNCLDD